MRYVQRLDMLNKRMLVVDPQDLELPGLVDVDYEQWLEFPIEVYPAFKPKENLDNWGIRMGVLDELFDELDYASLAKLCEALVFINSAIHTYDDKIREDLRKVENDNNVMLLKHVKKLDAEIAKTLIDVFEITDIIPTVRLFVHEVFDIKENVNIGRRSHDTKPNTFFPDEEREVLALALTCKLLLPLFGVYLTMVSSYTNCTMKDRYCCNMILPVLEKYFEPILKKLQIYSNNMIKPQESESYRVILGKSTEVIKSMIFDKIIVRMLINSRLQRGPSKIIGYLNMTITSNSRNPINVKGVHLQEIKNSDSKLYDDDDEGNESNLEADVFRSSAFPLYKSKVCTVYADYVVHRKLDEWDIPFDKYVEVEGYYMDNKIQITDMVLSTITKIFYNEFSSVGVRQLGYNSIVQLISLLVCRALTLECPQAIKLLTPYRVTTYKDVICQNIMLLKEYTTCEYYIKLRNYYNINISMTDGDVKFDEEFTSNMEVFDNSYKLNIPRDLQNTDTDITGDPLVITLADVNDLCKVIYCSIGGTKGDSTIR